MTGGFGKFLGPTGGFLVSYPIAVTLAASVRRSLERRGVRQVICDVVAACIIVIADILGWLWFMVVTQSDPLSAFLVADAPSSPSIAPRPHSPLPWPSPCARRFDGNGRDTLSACRRTRKSVSSSFLTKARARSSRAALAHVLGISRNSVSKAVSALRAEGHVIESVTNRGHRLVSSPSTFDARSIARLIDDPASRSSSTIP